jgi:signal transduction histidine kinase
MIILCLADLSEVVRNAVFGNEGFGQLFKVKVQLLPGMERVSAHFDSDRITQVVTNLLSNAVKFSPEGSTVDVCVTRLGKNARVPHRL